MNKALSVSQLNTLIQREISFNPYLKKLEVEAEIASMTRHRNGHLYFTIKDAFSSIDCVMFRSQAQHLKTNIDTGDQVLLHGQINLYEKNARLQFYVQSMELLGEGIFLKAFFALRDKLTAEGLLEETRKREIPAYPERIALLSSESGAARRDFLKVFHDRNPFCEILFKPVAVQGQQVVPEVIKALLEVEDSDVDLVVITRGGGSYEDLRWFNDELLARTVAQYPKPIISAIGHEVDLTIIELVSDRRGATPTEAAQLATVDVNQPLRSLEHFFRQEKTRRQQFFSKEKQWLESHLRDRFAFVLERKLTGEQAVLHEHRKRYQLGGERQVLQVQAQIKDHLNSFYHIFHRLRPQLEQSRDRMNVLLQESIKRARQEHHNLGELLRLVNPLETLQRGFAKIERQGQALDSVSDLHVGDEIISHLKDGTIRSTIQEVKKHEF